MYKPKLWLSWLMLTALLFSNVASAAVVLDGPNSQLSIGGNTGSAGQLLKVGSGGALEYGAIEAAGIANSSVTAEKLSIALTTTARDLLTPAAGMVVYNTTDSELQVYNGSSWVAAIVDTDTDTTYTAGTGLTLTGTVFSNDLGATIETGEITDGTILLADLDATAYETTTIDSVTNGDDLVTEAAVVAYLAANDTDTTYSAGTNKGILFTGTTVGLIETCTDGQVLSWNNGASTWDCTTDTTYTASGGVTLTGSNFTADLGTSIETGEITNGTILLEDLNATAYETTTIDSVTNGDDLVTEAAVVAYLAANDTDTTYTAGSGLLLTGTVFSADSLTLANIDAGAYETTTIDSVTNGDDLVTEAAVVAYLAANDTDTTYTAGTGLTLTGTVFSNDLGTSIETGEITDGTILLADLNATAYETTTIDSVTNGDDLVTEAAVVAYLAANDTDTTYTAGSGLLLTGTVFSADSLTLANIDAGAYETTTIDSVTNGDDLVTEAAVVAYVAANDTDTTYTAGTGLTLTGTVFSNDLGTSIETGEITDGTIAFGDLSVTTAYVTSGIDSVTGGDLLVTEAAVEAYVAANDTDTTYTAGTGLTLTGTVFSNDLGATIETGEITDGTILLADLNATAYETTTIDSVTNGDDLVTEAAVVAYLAANDTDTTYTAGSGLLLTGTVFSADSLTLANIDAGAYETTTIDSVTNGDDLVTEAAVVAYVAANDTDTTYTAGTGLTLTGTVFSNDLGATIETGEITDGTIAFGDLSVTTAYVTSGIDSVTGGDLLVTEAAVEAYVAANGDDLGNHTATQILVMGANKIVNTDDANDYGIAIGATGTLTTDNALTVTTGGADITGLLAVTGNITATGTITSTSDIAFKENVATVANPIQTLVALRGVQWDWKDDFAAATGQDGDLVTYGVIAQELETVLPSMVVTDNEGHKSVAYNQLTAFLIEAGKAQQTEIEALQARLNYLESLLLNVASAQ